MKPLTGVITAMVTPFDADGALDLDAARALARHLVANGSDGLVVSGTTGESPTLSDREKLDLLEAVVGEVADKATIVCGTGSNDTRHSVELTRAAVATGADAILAVTPYYNNPNRAGLLAHFAAIAEAAGDAPVILYNIPSRSVVNMPPDLLAELGRNPNVVAVKQANNAELQSIEGLDVLAGNDDSFLRTLEVGGVGGILVASHLVGPEMHAIYEAVRAGDLDRARQLDNELRPVYEALAVTTNPIPVKAALEMLGLCGGSMRLPMVPADDEQRAAIRAALERRGLLETSAAG